MTDYDPRTATGIPTEPVGSLPRPSRLQQAYGQYDAGEITHEQLEAEQDKAVKDSIDRGEATGEPIISDGEQRWSSFATYAITDTLAGTGLADHLAGDGGQYFAIFADGHTRQLPRLTGGPFRYKTYAADTLRKSIPLAHRPMKQAVIAPSMLALLYPLDSELPGYSREAFEEDLVNECEKDVRQAFAVGAARVSIDFTEGRLATRNDARNRNRNLATATEASSEIIEASSTVARVTARLLRKKRNTDPMPEACPLITVAKLPRVGCAGTRLGVSE